MSQTVLGRLLLSEGDLIALAVGLATFAVVIWTWFGLVERDQNLARVKAVAARRRELKQSAQSTPARRGARRGSPLAMLVRRLKLVQSSQSERLRAKLAQAGIRSTEARYLFLVGKLAAPFVMGFLAFLGVFATKLAGKPPAIQFGVMLAGVVIGFFVPDMFVSNLASKRRQALQRSLPDGLDLLVVCAEAGLALDTALHRVADELGSGAPELAEELELTAVELNFMPDRRHALLNLGKRVDLPAMRGVVNTLVQTEKYGTPLSQSLRVLSAEFREQRMLRAEEKAAKLPATLTVPMILFILPTLFVVLIGPAVLQVMDSFINRH